MRKLLMILTLGRFSLGIAEANTFNFTGVNSNELDVSFQLSVTVTDATNGGAKAELVFKNDGNGGTVDSFIGSIFFDMSLFTGVIAITGETTGVDFKNGKNGGNFPEGNTLSPMFDSAGFVTKDGAAANGVNNTPSGESLTVVANLNGTFQDLIDSLTAGDALLGLHMQGFDSRGSDSYVNASPLAHTQEPATLLLLGSGLLAGGLRFRKRFK